MEISAAEREVSRAISLATGPPVCPYSLMPHYLKGRRSDKTLLTRSSPLSAIRARLKPCSQWTRAGLAKAK